MAARDYLGLAFPDTATQAGDKIPAPTDLRARRQVLIDQSDQLDLIRYNDVQRAQAQDPPDAEEVALNALFVRFVGKQAPLLKSLGRDPDLLPDTVRMDGALQQAQGAVAEVLDKSREACIVLGSELTTGNDRCEETGAQLQTDPATPETKRFTIKACFTPIDNLRNDAQQAQQERLDRIRLREARQAAQLQAAQAPGQRLLKTEALRNAPLPSAGTATTAAKTKSKAKGKSKSKSKAKSKTAN